jgi:hypothetical protein
MHTPYPVFTKHPPPENHGALKQKVCIMVRMIRTNVHLEEAQKLRVQRLATKLNKTAAEVIRTSIAHFLEIHDNADTRTKPQAD